MRVLRGWPAALQFGQRDGNGNIPLTVLAALSSVAILDGSPSPAGIDEHPGC